MATLEQLEDALRNSAGSGDTETQQRVSDAMREHPTFQQNARQKLDSGLYKYGDDEVTELDKDAQRSNMSRNIARSMGLGDDEVDVTQGMGTYGRFKLSFQPTEQDKVKHLEDTYGRENIRAIDVGGKMKLLYRDEQETGNQFRAVDEEGVSLADFFGDTAGEVLPTIGAVAGGIAGTALSPILGTAAGSAAGYALAAGGQDVAVRAASGEDINFGDIAKRTAIETAIGVPIDLATAGLAKGISSRIGKNLADEYVGGLAKAESVLNKSEALSSAGIKLAPDMRVSKGAVDSASEIAGSRKGSKIAGQYQRLRDNIAKYKEAATTGVADTGESFGKTTQRIAGQYRQLIDDVAVIDKEAAGVLEGSLSRRMNRLVAKDRVNLDNLGKRWTKLFDTAQTAVSKQGKDNFDEVGRMAAERGVSVTNKEVKASITSALSKFKVKKNPEVDKIIAGLDDNGSMDFQTMREYIETIQDAVPTGGASGGKTSAQVASVAAESLRKLRTKVAKTGGEGFAKAYDNANQFYTDKVLSYKRGPAGKALASKFGGDTSTPSQVANDILSDPAKIRQALDSIDPADDVSRSTAVKELQDAFLSKHGMDGTVDLSNGINLSNADKSVIEELWSHGSGGVKDASKGKRKLASFERLNQQVKQIKDADLSKVTAEDLEELFSSFSQQDVQVLATKIAKRTAKEKQAEALAGNVILNKIIRGDFTELDASTFADTLISADSGKVAKVMKVLSEGSSEEVQAVRQEYVSQLFAKYSNGAQLDSGSLGIWNPQAMAKDLAGKNGKKLQKNMELVLGKTQASEILAANKVLAAASALGGKTAPDIKPRFIFSPTTIAGYFVGDLMGGVKNRVMGWAYGTEALVPLMKLMSKKVSDEQFEKNFSKIVGAMLASEKGITSASREGDIDPNFQEAALSAASSLKEQ